VLRRSDIRDRAVADYVAEVLAEFSRVERVRCVVPGQSAPLEYFFEMLAALQMADDRTSFLFACTSGIILSFSPAYFRTVSGIGPRRAGFRT